LAKKAFGPHLPPLLIEERKRGEKGETVAAPQAKNLLRAFPKGEAEGGVSIKIRIGRTKNWSL